MFHFPAFPPHTLYIQMQVTRHHSCWVSPFGNPRITARLTAPRGISQPPTSFIGSWCQGIHRTPLNTYKQRYSRPLCSSQTTHPPEPPPRPDRKHIAVSRKTRTDRHLSRRNNACSLRTQQCADYIPAPEAKQLRTNRGTCQCSTHEQPPNHSRIRNGLCHNTITHVTRSGECSLERR